MALRHAGFLAMGGQIVDAIVVAAPNQRNTEAEKADLEAGRVPDAWKAKPAEDVSKRIDLAVPTFGSRTTSASITATG